MKDNHALENLRAWRDTLLTATVRNQELYDADGEVIYFLAAERSNGTKNILLSFGGPGLRIYYGKRSNELIMHGYSWDEDVEETVSFPTPVHDHLIKLLNLIP